MAATETQTDPALAAAFREAFRHHPAGVAVITADPGDGPVAMTISSLISISADPPTVAFSLSARTSSAGAVRRAETFVIHFLRLENLELARLGAQSGADRFGPDCRWERLPGGEPYYPEAQTRFRARALHELTVEGATLIVARLLDGAAGGAGADPAPEDHSMVYLNRGWHGLRRLP